MGKGATSLTNSLYKINDKIAQASNKMPMPGVPEVPVQQQVTERKKELAPERIIEFNRMHHDLEIRIESMISEYRSEIELIEQRMKELNASVTQINQLKQELETIVLPDNEEPEPERQLSKQLRALEMMRLETIRIAKKMDAAKGNSSNTSTQSNEINLMDIPNSDIIKKGFAFFFPLSLAILICTIIMALAYIFAWKSLV